MMESRIVLTERLRREGRWAAASAFKDAVVKELRAGGMKRSEATEEAWLRMATEYPPIVSGPLPADQPDSDAFAGSGADDLLDREDDGESPDLARDTLWVYQNLSKKAVRPEQAPSCGAWSLLLWAREYRSRFFEVFLPKATKDVDDGGERELIAAEEQSVEEIRTILQQTIDAAAGQRRDEFAVATTDFIDRWAAEHRPSLSPSARDGLEAGIIELLASG